MRKPWPLYYCSLAPCDVPVDSRRIPTFTTGEVSSMLI